MMLSTIHVFIGLPRVLFYEEPFKPVAYFLLGRILHIDLYEFVIYSVRVQLLYYLYINDFIGIPIPKRFWFILCLFPLLMVSFGKNRRP